MLIVVDSSVLVAALRRSSRVRALLYRQGLEWVLPSDVRAEILDRLETLAPRLGVSSKEARFFVEEILERSTELEVRPRERAAVKARRLIGGRDPSDIPFLAAAIRVEALGIWSLDKDFDGIAGVPRFTTAGIERLLNLVGTSEEE